MDRSQAFLLIGLLLLILVLASATLRRGPTSTAMLYLFFGWASGYLGWLKLEVPRDGAALELLAEIAVLLSLFTAGLKLRTPLRSPLWRLPGALASLCMVLTVALVALSASLAGMPMGAAVLLGAIVAPTDPVLASAVQVLDTRDTNRLRFTLTGEAGLNDGTAFPFVLLGLGLMGFHPLGMHGLDWLIRDVLWATVAGLGTGAILGTVVGRLVVSLRRRYRRAVGYDDFLALGLVATSYGLALAVHGYGFLAVFAAGVALRTVERHLATAANSHAARGTMERDIRFEDQAGGVPESMATAVLNFNEQMERLGEVALMVVTGVLLSQIRPTVGVLLFALALFLIIRPLAVTPIALFAGMNIRQSAMVAWFGIRGIGSLYYLIFAVNRGLPPETADGLMQVVLCVIAASVILHGLSVGPLMQRYSADRSP